MRKQASTKDQHRPTAARRPPGRSAPTQQQQPFGQQRHPVTAAGGGFTTEWGFALAVESPVSASNTSIGQVFPGQPAARRQQEPEKLPQRGG